MGDMRLKAPVLFLIFNRPDTTQRVFDAIRQAKPARLFVAADGPREDRHGEAEKCTQARSIIGNIDWDCEVVTRFREKNLGCRKAVSSAIDWFFENVEEGIILEDDCLPSRSFFMYCDELLAHYRDDTKVMQICGSNYFKGFETREKSYFFSRFGPIWGWASWRRAWGYYDVDMRLWPEIKKNKVSKNFYESKDEELNRIAVYDKTFSGEIDTWDYQWSFAKMINAGLSIIPSVNLIANIGFSSEATHTSDPSDPFSNMESKNLSFPLSHPVRVSADRAADRMFVENVLLRGVKKSSFKRFLNLLKKRSGP